MTSPLTPDDILRQTAAIMNKYEDWWREDQARAELKALWGDAINDAGVFTHHEDESLYNRDGCKAEVSVGGAHGLYAFGCSFTYPTGGFGNAPSISGDLFPSRDAARTAGIEYLVKRMPKQLFAHEDTHRNRIDHARAALEGLLRQPSLF
jgi:hypothetical protein